MRLISQLSLGNRFFQLALLAGLLVGVVWFLVPPSFDLAQHLRLPPIFTRPGSQTLPADSDLPPRPNHPIDHLIHHAEEEFAALMNKRANSVEDAAQAYRERRGRQPPPGFDAWYSFATEKSAVMIEDLFDRIYHDLNPFWAIPAKQIREQANGFLHRISVRDGVLSKRSDDADRAWMNLWFDMVNSIAVGLPDLDMPINVMDESRIVVPWEEINGYMQKESATRKIVPADRLRTTFRSLSDLDRNPPEPYDGGFDSNGHYWSLAVVGCPPNSPARNVPLETDYSTPPPLTGQYPPESYYGFVKNWTFATSPCDHPALQGLHGTFVEPVSLSNTAKMMPLFGGCKLPMNNEILLPPAMYWTDDPFYSGGEDHGVAWAKKNDTMIWRGTASGGRNKDENWTRFQRHRFVSMVNGTNVERAANASAQRPLNFVLPANESYELAARGPDSHPADFGDWVNTWSDVALVDLECFPQATPRSTQCPYTDPYFTVAESLPMSAQYFNKYLPDIDGNSYSGRYRGFLRSTSLPIKATIYNEWHDSRLMPWKHFVPMDNTYIDIYGIMEYFLGNRAKGLGGHDKEAERIAMNGKEWADVVLRKEDMSVYVYRLLLEYARLCDDDREIMGWAESNDMAV